MPPRRRAPGNLKGISPGPQPIGEHPDVFWSLVVSFVIGNALLVIWHIPFIRVWVRLLAVPFDLLYPVVLVFYCLGVYSIHRLVADVLSLLVFGLIGYGMRLLRSEPAPLLIGLVLGPMIEEYLRRSLIVSHGDLLIFVERPIGAGVLAFAFAVMAWTISKSFRRGSP